MLAEKVSNVLKTTGKSNKRDQDGIRVYKVCQTVVSWVRHPTKIYCDLADTLIVTSLTL